MARSITPRRNGGWHRRAAGTPCRRRTCRPAAAHVLARHLLAQELVGNLDQDAGAVAQQRVVAGSAAMFEVLQDLQALLDDGVAFLVLDMGDKADAAGVALVFGVVETLALGEDHRVFPRKCDRQSAEISAKRGRQKSRGVAAPRPWTFRPSRRTFKYTAKSPVDFNTLQRSNQNSLTANRRRCSFIE
jgi:hypothetical protein